MEKKVLSIKRLGSQIYMRFPNGVPADLVQSDYISFKKRDGRLKIFSSDPSEGWKLSSDSSTGIKNRCVVGRESAVKLIDSFIGEYDTLHMGEGYRYIDREEKISEEPVPESEPENTDDIIITKTEESKTIEEESMQEESTNVVSVATPVKDGVYAVRIVK